MEKYVYSGTKRLRCGFTTGSCAAAAAAAAAQMLLGGRVVESVTLEIPSGDVLDIPIIKQEITAERAVCAVVKDSGDDPDITNGIEVFAEVTRTESGFSVTGGEGIGKVTKPGLDRAPGEYAINSTPRRMIAAALTRAAEEFGYSGGLRAVISAPAGSELAKKTFNPRMGIVGGISIIGTTGIVKPMSSAALVDTIRAEAAMRRAAGHDYLLLTVGNYSEEHLRLHAGDLSEQTVTCSNFIGDALDIAVTEGFKGVLLVGHIGKLVKLGSGIMNTHSAYADGRMETLIACGVLAGADPALLSKIPDCMTVDAALDILFSGDKTAAQKTLDVLAERAERYLNARAKGELEAAAVMFSTKHELVIKTPHTEKILTQVLTGPRRTGLDVTSL